VTHAKNYSALRTPHSALNELPCAHRFRLRRQHPGGDCVLFAEAQARGEAGFQHVALAKISRRYAGQCAVSETAQELVALFANSPAPAGGTRVGATLLRHHGQTSAIARRHSRRLGFHASHG
jgi:hypothetical protein